MTGEPSTLPTDHELDSPTNDQRAGSPQGGTGQHGGTGSPAGGTGHTGTQQHSDARQDAGIMQDTEMTDRALTDAPSANANPELPLGIRSIDDSESAAGAQAVADVVPEHDLVGALEAVLLIVDAPVSEVALAGAVGHRPARIREVLLALAEHYTAAFSGIELREINGGWRYYTRDRFAPVVERFVLDGAQSRLSRAALETLAVVAYRQPVTRARVSGVRGVNVDGVVRTLTSRGLIEDAGTDPDTGAVLYRTTDLFLERLGLSDLSELPSLGPLLPDIDGIDDV